MGDEFISRWSRLKREARSREEQPAPPADAPDPPSAPPSENAMPSPPAEPTPLPPVDSLTPDSDFSPFMAREVDPGLRRDALRALFKDERFNVMDRLDVYIDDYSKPDPIPADWMEKIGVLARLGHHPDPKPEVAAVSGEGRPATLPVASDAEPVEPAQAEPAAKTVESAGALKPPSDTAG